MWLLKSSGGPSGLAEFSPDTLTPAEGRLYLLAFHFVVAPPAFSLRENAEVVKERKGSS